MCTVAYIPLGGGEFLIGSSRDESPYRGAIKPPFIHSTDGGRNLAPLDQKGGGTWISFSEKGRFMVIMNGAFAPHKRRPPYQMSRGMVPYLFPEYPSAPEFCQKVDLTGVEPFTAIIIENLHKTDLWEFKWDGCRKHLFEIRSDRPGIWSSDNLFRREVHQKRVKWLNDFLRANPYPGMRDLQSFFGEAGKDAAPADEQIDMKIGDKVQSVSFTFASFSQDGWLVNYIDSIYSRCNTKVELALSR